MEPLKIAMFRGNFENAIGISNIPDIAKKYF